MKTPSPEQQLAGVIAKFTPATLDQADVRALMQAALDRAGRPITPDCGHRLIIKSVSAKQRPRRPAVTARKPRRSSPEG